MVCISLRAIEKTIRGKGDFAVIASLATSAAMHKHFDGPVSDPNRCGQFEPAFATMSATLSGPHPHPWPKAHSQLSNEQGGQVYTHTHGQAIGQSHSWAHAKAVRRTRSKMGIGSTAAWPGPRLPAWQSKVWSTAGSTVPQPGPRLGVQQSSQPHANAIAKRSGQADGWVQSKAVGPTAGSTAKWPWPLSQQSGELRQRNHNRFTAGRPRPRLCPLQT